jgi:D-lactate dehydrogenase
MMWRIKQLADPDGILAPGVLLNRDPGVHLRNLKGTPEIEEVVTKCIECGFCEPVCPSRHVTTTPRQRIVIRREIARQPEGSPVRQALLEQYEYDGVETCAVDGSCMHACPVAIDTGKLIKDLRARQHGPREERAALEVARRYGWVERAARIGLRVGGRATRAWRPSIPQAAPAQLPFTVREGAAAVYMPACINRIFGNRAGGPSHPTVPEALVAISARAGLPLWIPDDAHGVCCGTPWTSKGFASGHEEMSRRAGAALERWSDGGRLAVVTDASSCAHGLIDEVEVQGVEVLDSIAWVHDRLLARLELRRKLGSVVVHPTCASKHLGLSGKLAAVAEQLADEVVVPAGTGCCGMAGDRGWLHPELPASALREVAAEVGEREFDAYVSSNRTCEAALQAVTGRPYASFVLALEEATR